jgi:hypothetical protein
MTRLDGSGVTAWGGLVGGTTMTGGGTTGGTTTGGGTNGGGTTGGTTTTGGAMAGGWTTPTVGGGLSGGKKACAVGVKTVNGTTPSVTFGNTDFQRARRRAISSSFRRLPGLCGMCNLFRPIE